MSASQLTFGPREWQLVYRVALGVVTVPDQAEDIAQEALLNAYQARHTFAGLASPDSWLYRIAYNTAMTYLRRPFRRRHANTDVFRTIDEAASREPANDSPEDAAIARQLASILDVCLSEMRAKDRLAFTERYLLGTSERELGELLGVSTNAAKQRAFRARRAVRSRFAAARQPAAGEG